MKTIYGLVFEQYVSGKMSTRELSQAHNVSIQRIRQIIRRRFRRICEHASVADLERVGVYELVVNMNGTIKNISKIKDTPAWLTLNVQLENQIEANGGRYGLKA